MKLNKARQELADLFIKSLEENTVPWQKGWYTSSIFNATTNIHYHGVNKFLLTLVSQVEEYIDPRWVTFNQAQKAGWQVTSKAKGKGVPIEFWSLYDTLQGKTISQEEMQTILNKNPERKNDIQMVSKTYIVFNAEFVDGIPPLEERKYNFEPSELASDMIRNYLENENIKILYGGNEANYNVAADSIICPNVSSFYDEYRYLSTLLHECAHSTGAKTRLNRFNINQVNDENYAIEELRAEIAASFLSSEFNIKIEEKHLDNHKAYIKSWIKKIKEKPDELFKAINDADKISNYFLNSSGYEQYLEKNIQQDLEDDVEEEMEL